MTIKEHHKELFLTVRALHFNLAFVNGFYNQLFTSLCFNKCIFNQKIRGTYKRRSTVNGLPNPDHNALFRTMKMAPLGENEALIPLMLGLLSPSFVFISIIS